MESLSNQSVSENEQVTKAAGIVGSATLLSRIFGFLRDVVIAWFFGAGLGSDAFFVAFRIPNLLRRLFAEGSLTIAFIPVFTDYLSHSGRDEAFELARSAFRILAILLIITVVVGIFITPLIIHIIAPGFVKSPDKFNLTVELTRIMFPYVFFICLVALSMGILNSLGHFAAPAMAPVLLNISMIGSVFVLSSRMASPVKGLAIGVLIGGMLQLLLQVPFLIKKGVYFWQKAKLYHPGLKKIGKLMLPAVFGAAVYQVNIVIGTLLASLLPEGSVSYLYYADRLVQFPLGIFGIAAATAVLPSLSRQAAANDLAALRSTFTHGINLVFFITIPAMVGLIVLREPIVALLFKRGAFDENTVHMTAIAVFCYGVGLWAFSAVRIPVSTFYALQDTRTPVKIAIVSVVANIVLGIIFIILMKPPFQHGGLALATSLASMLNFVLLIRALKRRLGEFGWRDIAISVGRILIGSGIMGIAVWMMVHGLITFEGQSFSGQVWRLLVSIGTGILLYGMCTFFIKSPELNAIRMLITQQQKDNIK